MAMIEAPLSFFQMKMERYVGNSFEFGQPDFGKAPEAFNAVDMHATAREFILRMINSKVSRCKIEESVVAAPSVRIDNG